MRENKRQIAADEFAGAVLAAGYSLNQEGAMAYMIDNMGYSLESFKDGNEGFEILQMLQREGALKEVYPQGDDSWVERSVSELVSSLVNQNVNNGVVDYFTVHASIMASLVDAYGCSVAKKASKEVEAKLRMAGLDANVSDPRSLERLAHFTVFKFFDKSSYERANEALDLDSALRDVDVYLIPSENMFIVSPEGGDAINSSLREMKMVDYSVQKLASLGAEPLHISFSADDARYVVCSMKEQGFSKEAIRQMNWSAFNELFHPKYASRMYDAGVFASSIRPKVVTALDENYDEQRKDELTDQITFDIAKVASDAIDRYPSDIDLAFMYASSALAKNYGESVVANLTDELRSAVNDEQTKRSVMQQGLLKESPQESADVGVLAAEKKAGLGDEMPELYSPSDEEEPIQCWNCLADILPGSEAYEVTVDADPGDPEVGPRPDIVEVLICPKCAENWKYPKKKVVAEKEEIVVYDNGGKTADRYTVFIDKYVYGMGDTPKDPGGFNQFLGERSEGYKEGPHLGNKVAFESLPQEVQDAILERRGSKKTADVEKFEVGQRIKVIDDGREGTVAHQDWHQGVGMLTVMMDPTDKEEEHEEEFEPRLVKKIASKKTAAGRKCFHLTESGKIVEIRENEPGYYETDIPVTTSNRDVVEAQVKKMNDALGLTPDDVHDIIISSMFPKRKGAGDMFHYSREEAYNTLRFEYTSSQLRDYAARNSIDLSGLPENATKKQLFAKVWESVKDIFPEKKTAAGDGIPPNDSPDWPYGKRYDNTLKMLKDQNDRSSGLRGGFSEKAVMKKASGSGDELEEDTFDPNEVEVGDYVDFGPYGKLYVVNLDAGLGDRPKWWVTDDEDDRYNPSARGWFIIPGFAKGIVEKGRSRKSSKKIASIDVGDFIEYNLDRVKQYSTRARLVNSWEGRVKRVHSNGYTVLADGITFFVTGRDVIYPEEVKKTKGSSDSVIGSHVKETISALSRYKVSITDVEEDPVLFVEGKVIVEGKEYPFTWRAKETTLNFMSGKPKFTTESENRVIDKVYESALRWLDKNKTANLKRAYTPEEIAEKHGVEVGDMDKALRVGQEIEMEHTDDPEEAARIASHHLWEHADYYDKEVGLPAMEEELEHDEEVLLEVGASKKIAAFDTWFQKNKDNLKRMYDNLRSNMGMDFDEWAKNRYQKFYSMASKRIASGDWKEEMWGDSSWWDKEVGSVDELGWYALVLDAPDGKSYILREDNQGFKDEYPFDSADDATIAFKAVDDEYDKFYEAEEEAFS